MSEEIKGFQYIYEDDDDEGIIPGTVVLDFLNCRYLHDIYQEMRIKMKWADYYGSNLDALWDILTGMPYYGSDFIILRRREYHDIPINAEKSFGEYIDKIYSIFQEAVEKNSDGRMSFKMSVKMLYDDELDSSNESFAV